MPMWENLILVEHLRLTEVIRAHKLMQKFNLWVEHLCLTKVGNGMLGECVHWKIQHSFNVGRKCHVPKKN